MNATMVEMADSRKKEMDEMRGHIRKLEQKFDDRDRSMGNQNNNKRRDPLKCKNCKDQNLPRCTHCVKCLEEGHKQDQCTKKLVVADHEGNESAQLKSPLFNCPDERAA